MTGCVNQHAIKQPNVLTNTDSREQTLKTLSQWRIAGKIAFIQTDKRESANLHWSVDQEAQQQSLRMTTYLGINVLSLEQENELTTIEVDGESYQGDDLELLVWRLTGFTLPTKAIQYWIKGIPFYLQIVSKLMNKICLLYYPVNMTIKHGLFATSNTKQSKVINSPLR